MQSLDFALKRLDQVVKKKIDESKLNCQKKINQMSKSIIELEEEIQSGKNKIKLLQSIIKETIESLDEMIEKMSKISL